jgi:hypothetical protein
MEEPIGTIYCAAQDAAEELDLRLLRCALDGIAGEIVALDAHLDTVNIRLEALPEDRSLLMIRVGVFGSKNKSVVLFSQILEQWAGQGNAASKDDCYR